MLSGTEIFPPLSELLEEMRGREKEVGRRAGRPAAGSGGLGGEEEQGRGERRGPAGGGRSGLT